MSETNVIVEGRSLSKEFNGNVVLRDVSIRCEAGKAIALVGENGAGKSTLMNILTGSLTPTSGTVLVDGKEVHFTSPHQSKAMGLAFVHQELSLMEEMTVGENIMLGREPRHFGRKRFCGTSATRSMCMRSCRILRPPISRLPKSRKPGPESPE